MSETDLSQQIQQLKDEEEKLLAELRLKRFIEMESKRKEIEKRAEEEEMKNLMAKESELSKKLHEIKRKNFQLKMEATAWENLSKSKTSERRNLEKKLNECYEKIWTNRDVFCDKIDAFLKDRNNTFTNSLPQREQHVYNDNGSDEDINKLMESIAAEEALEKSYEKTQNELQDEKEKLSEVPNGPEYKRLEEWIEITRDRCTELNRRIREKRKLTDSKKNPGSNQLFSIVNLEDVKKLIQKWK